MKYLLFIPLLLLPLTLGALTVNLASTDLERGSSQYWSRADDADFDFTSNYTLTAWINMESLNGVGERYVVIGKWNNAAGARSYQAEFINPAGTRSTNFIYSADGGGVEDSFTEAVTISAGTWYHLAWVFNDTANEFKTYVNGAQLGSTDAPGASTFNGNEDFRVGAVRDSSAPAFFFDGKIDDVRVWSRALSDADILSLATTPCTFANGASLTGWWLFDNDGADSSGGSNTLTNNNVATFSTPAYSCGGPGFNPYYFMDF